MSLRQWKVKILWPLLAWWRMKLAEAHCMLDEKTRVKAFRVSKLFSGQFPWQMFEWKSLKVFTFDEKSHENLAKIIKLSFGDCFNRRVMMWRLTVRSSQKNNTSLFFFSLLISSVCRFSFRCLSWSVCRQKKKNEEKQKKIRTNYTGAEF